MATHATNRKVLVAIDASPNAKKAFEWYMSQIYRPSDLVVIGHATEPPHLPSLKPLKHGLNIPVEEWKNVIQEQLSKVQKLEQDYEADLLSKRASYKMCCSEQDKNPGQAIIRLAESEHVDMIVMGTRGLDALRRTLLGSVSDYVVRHSSVPVIICPLKK